MTIRKTDPRKKLAALTAEQVVQLMAWLRTPGLSLARAVELVKEKFGVSVSDSTLSRFYEEQATEEIREKTLRSAGIASSVAQLLTEKSPEIRKATKGQLTHRIFELVQAGDADAAKVFADVLGGMDKGDRELRRLEQQQVSLEQQDRKIKLLEAKAAKADAANGVMADAELTEDEKAKRLKQIFRMS